MRNGSGDVGDGRKEWMQSSTAGTSRYIYTQQQQCSFGDKGKIADQKLSGDLIWAEEKKKFFFF